MKKLLFAASLVVASLTVNAQDEGFTSKNGHQVLPEAGDISISFDAVPFFEFIGNAFNNDADNTVRTDYPLGDQAITGRYFLDATTAIRARVRIGLQSSTSKTLVGKVGSTTGELVEDETKTKSSDIVLAAGLEKRRGSHRVQGYYGAELVFQIDSDPNQKFTYGNAISSTNPVAIPRTLENKYGNDLSVGPRGFIGVDYFLAPKIAIGGEFGWGLFLSKTGESETTTEFWNGTAVETKTTRTSAGSGSIGLDTDNLSGSINLSFFF